MARRSDQVAAHLTAHGVRRGDRVLLMLNNQVELWESMLAVMKLGAVILPTTTALGPADIIDRIERGEARHVLANAADAGKFDAAFTVRGEDVDLDLGLDSSNVVRPGFVVADLAGGYDVNEHVRLTARVENLANAHYEEVFGFGEPGTAVYLGVKLKD